MTNLIQTLISGLSLGSIYALIALGYTMVYGIAKMLNFAHGDVIMVGAYSGIVAVAQMGLSPWVTVIVSIAVCAVLGVVIEFCAYKPLRQAAPLSVLITAIGVSYLLQNAALLIFGSQQMAYPTLLKLPMLTVGSVQIDGITLLTLAVMLNLKRSKYGRAIMAIRDNRIAAESVGLSVTRYKLAVFVIAAFFAGCAGVLYGHSLANIKAAAFDYNMSIEILVIVVLGGMGSVPGSVVSAIVLTVLPEALREVADYRMLVYAVVLILVMQATNNPAMKRFFGAACKSLTPKRKERAAL